MLLVVGLSTIVGWLRGAVREVFALFALFGALIAARWFAADVALWLPASIPGATLRVIVAGLAVWIVSWLALTILGLWLRQVTHGFGFGAADRTFGAVFGLLRGVAVVLVFAIIASHTPLGRQPFWQRAIMSASLEQAAQWIVGWVRERPKTLQTGDGKVVKAIKSHEIGLGGA